MPFSTDSWTLPLVFGGNVFGWTADDATSFSLLDAYVAAGGLMVDTADVYSAWAPGHSGGESERVIGAWLAANGRPDGFMVASKVAKHPEFRGLAPANIRAAAEQSLQRLGVDHIDLYYAHEDDPSTPVVDAVRALGALVDDGLVTHIGLSNFTAERVDEFASTANELGVTAPSVYQGAYNLVDRSEHEQLVPVLERHSIVALPYYGLAKGFLTGKYRDGGPTVEGPRAAGAQAYLDDRGRRILAALDAVASAHNASVAAVALAWVVSRPAVGATIASARNVEQFEQLADIARLVDGGSSPLTSAELDSLTAASAA